ncbi:MAG: L-2-hydroxyglutarate oxidase [Cardiobacteriaceae bacterium]|nr:L-2-hydroxyglutarate oxidase [Cardiobacteriaceae bacterium]
MVDFAVIGAGILGLSTAMQLSERFPGSRIVVLEKEDGVARHQTGHNSGVIHAGVYYAPGSLKAELCRAGNAATKAFCREHGIAFDACGKLLVATNALELERMQALYTRSAENGIEREWWDAAQLAAREPNVRGVAAIFVPSTAIVSYRQISEKMAEIIRDRGDDIRLNTPVQRIAETGDHILLHTVHGELRTRFLVSCAGLQADRVVAMSGIAPDFTICPFRGEYYRLPEKHNRIVRHLIYPIPDPAVPFLGVHLTRMIDGSVTVGPNAVLAMQREGYRKRDINLRDIGQMLANPAIRRVLFRHWRHGLKEQRNSWFKRFYLQEVRKYCPAITLADLGDYPAGVRAQAVAADGTLIDDFRWQHTPRSLHVCNAPSPAATSAIPIGARIVAQVAEKMTEQAS